MNKTIRNLAIAALFILPGLSGFPQEVQQSGAQCEAVLSDRLQTPAIIFDFWYNTRAY